MKRVCFNENCKSLPLIKRCKACWNSYHRERYSKLLAHPRKRNPPKNKAASESKKRNFKSNRNYLRKRRERIKLCTPKWLSDEQLLKIKLFYKNKPNEMTVDHIIPIFGKNVSGLHVPWNLQYLSMEENILKGAKMPGGN